MSDPFEEWYERHKAEFKCSEAKLNAMTAILGILIGVVFFVCLK